ncbi:SDR family NAD(P)-dependent oxidoreductase [Corallincola platygyrae]|uniref:SDR family NAD(P)-dependent oxidoreductase n=1 Tax=Corallincola platygyrae TaxID=1193278 RepID=A0ABW4XKL1_9GAMM
MRQQPRVVLITGASSGIGHALANSFLAAGCLVVATARNIKSLENLEQSGAYPLSLDVTDTAACHHAIEHCIEKFGRIDVLVNNAGYGQIGALLDLSDEQLHNQFAVNCVAPLRLCRLAALRMTEQGSGLLVNIGSVSGITVTPFAGAYCASKAAFHALDDALRMELAPFNVKVVTVQPGAIQSSFTKAADQHLAPAGSLYNRYRAGIAKRAGMSQRNATPAKHLADYVVTRLLKTENPPAIIRFGYGARLLPLMSLLVPRRLRQRILSKTFGLC